MLQTGAEETINSNASEIQLDTELTSIKIGEGKGDMFQVPLGTEGSIEGEVVNGIAAPILMLDSDVNCTF